MSQSRNFSSSWITQEPPSSSFKMVVFLQTLVEDQTSETSSEESSPLWRRTDGGKRSENWKDSWNCSRNTRKTWKKYSVPSDNTSPSVISLESSMKDGATPNQVTKRNLSNCCPNPRASWLSTNGSWPWSHGVSQPMLSLKFQKLLPQTICMLKSQLEDRKSPKPLIRFFTTQFNTQKLTICITRITDSTNSRERLWQSWKTSKKRKKVTTSFCLTGALSTPTQEVKSTISEQSCSTVKSSMFTTLKRSESVSCIIWVKKSTQLQLLANKSREKSTKKEETPWSVSTQVLTSYMRPPEEFSVHTYGNTVPRRPNTTLILISLTTNQSAKKRKCKSKTKLTKSSSKVIPSASISKTRKLLRKSSASTCIKEVSYQETQSESWTSKELTSRLAVVLTLTIPTKLVGSRSSRPPESPTVS